jgi:nicotinate-nucleotide adenylyltransferase
MKIGLLGGSFNPIHCGHIAAARAVWKQLHLDKVWFVPTGKHAFDKPLLPWETRAELIRAALHEFSHLELSEIDSDSKNTGFTFNLIKKLKIDTPENTFYFIIGADNVPELPLWYKYEELLDEMQFVVLNRPGNDIHRFSNLRYFDKLLFIEMEPVNISSSEIRERIKDKQSISGMVPECVEKLVSEIYW